jgi:methylmalonyl-CoA mutase N-terminal domain/subunit
MKPAAPGETSRDTARTVTAGDRTFTTISGRPIDQLYTPERIAALDYERDLADPGQYPYTRGIHPAAIAASSGRCASSPASERRRRPTALQGAARSRRHRPERRVRPADADGRDPDHELSRGEVGKCGVNVTSLADMEALFDGIDLGAVTTSMTINSPAR